MLGVANELFIFRMTNEGDGFNVVESQGFQ